jgi:hypothetical protein
MNLQVEVLALLTVGFRYDFLGSLPKEYGEDFSLLFVHLAWFYKFCGNFKIHFYFLTTLWGNKSIQKNPHK